MKTPQFFFGKFLLVLLAFFSQAGMSTFAFPSELFEPDTEKAQFREAHPVLLVFDQTENLEVPEASERTSLSYGKSNPSEVIFLERVFLTNSYSFLKRDLRAAITAQLFPYHFFL
ncbi:hypothetical protein [Salinimicrobium gaetbulicola]|uniref:Uncharacterized protein n=1 Tax=Salinimicrobium gaetbulicola TaxID=999702 RepID=A0ABW3II15_9FLAO